MVHWEVKTAPKPNFLNRMGKMVNRIVKIVTKFNFSNKIGKVIDVVADQAARCIVRRKCDRRQMRGRKLLRLQRADVGIAEEAMHFRAQVPQPHAGIAGRPAAVEFRNDLFQRRIVVQITQLHDVAVTKLDIQSVGDVFAFLWFESAVKKLKPRPDALCPVSFYMSRKGSRVSF